MDDKFICSSCGKDMDWNECVSEEVLIQMGLDDINCYNCVSTGICYDAMWSIPFPVTKEEYELHKANRIRNLRAERKLR